MILAFIITTIRQQTCQSFQCHHLIQLKIHNTQTPSSHFEPNFQKINQSKFVSDHIFQNGKQNPEKKTLSITK